MSERTIVLVPAFEEETRIHGVLSALPRTSTEPIVVVNGSSDRTAEIARGYGVNVVDIPEQGKLPAMQRTLRNLGSRALAPLLILDADNPPFFPARWHTGMLSALTGDTCKHPVAVGGPTWFTEGGIVDDALKSVRRLQRAYQGRQWQPDMTPGQCGPNMGLHLKSPSALDAIMDLPHYWPGEDIALVDTVVGQEGHYYQPVHPAMMTRNPSSKSYPSAFQRFRMGTEASRNAIRAHYAERGAPGSVPYIHGESGSLKQ